MANVKDDRGRVMCSALPTYSRHLVVYGHDYAAAHDIQ
jgi:hypothetical protein